LKLKPNLIVHINYEKFTVALRNEVLIAFAKERIGETTSLIYGEGLRLLEGKIPRCQLDAKIDAVVDLPDGPVFTTKELTAALGNSINPGTGIGKAPGEQVDARDREHHSEVRKSKSRQTEMDSDISMGEGDDDQPKANGHSIPPDDDEDDPFNDSPKRNSAKRPRVTFEDRLPIPEPFEDRENRAELVKKHLSLLQVDDVQFLRKCGTNGMGEWTCDFDNIVLKMQETEVDALLLENFGSSGHRLGRMLRKLGKLDEKTLSDAGKLKPKDVRTKLAEMQMASVIDIQEVPRDSNRTANRTIYLWSFNEERAASMVLEHTYKAMSRILQRLDIERRRAHDVLALTQRSDVRNMKPEEYLDTHQLNDFRAINAKIDSLMCQITRLDRLVGLFKEF
jgi:DNA-directed RNA polymerase III subunit RPC3